MTSSIPNEQFDDSVKQYVSINKPFLAILTPCFQGLCHTKYTICLLQTVKLLEHYEIGYIVEFCNSDSLISRARNNLIAKAMSYTEVTHIMFIDNDIDWIPIDILKLLIAEKPIIGGIYPKKKYHFELLNESFLKTIMERKRTSELDKIITDDEYIQYNLLEYNVNYLSSNTKIERNLAKVKHIATGFMMIQRKTIETMMEVFPSTKYTDDVGFLQVDENRFAFSLFDCGIENGHYLSEDWMFCHRWSAVGGDIWMDVSIRLGHQGHDGYFLATIL